MIYTDYPNLTANCCPHHWSSHSCEGENVRTDQSHSATSADLLLIVIVAIVEQPWLLEANSSLGLPKFAEFAEDSLVASRKGKMLLQS